MGIEVKCLVHIYEQNGIETKVGDANTNLVVESVFTRSSLVSIGTKKIIVSGVDLITAIRNAMSI